MSEANQAVTPQRIMELLWGFAPSMMIAAAGKDGLFDALAGGPKSIDELATATGASQRGIAALAEGLAGVGVLMRQGHKFGLSAEAGQFLVSGKRGYLGGFAAHITGQLVEHWLHLPEIVKTGKPVTGVNRQETGAEFFKQFVEDLYDANLAGAEALADDLAPQLSAVQQPSILDIAAGSGVWSIALAKRLPNARVTAVDWDAVTPVTRRVAQREGVADRLRTIGGDILQVDFAGPHHVATLGHILHSEGEDRSRKLIRRVHDALSPGGIIAIIEFSPLDDRSGPPFPLIFGVNMLVETDHGAVFTMAQMTDWLNESGFTDVRQIKGKTPSPMLVGVKR